jgi:hypothetical protein
MDHLEVLREKIARLRAEIAAIQESNQEYRLREWLETEAQVAHGERQERLLGIQQELAQVADLGRRILSVLSGHPKTGQWWSGQNRPTGRGRGLSCFILPPPVVASLFSYANSEDHI